MGYYSCCALTLKNEDFNVLISKARQEEDEDAKDIITAADIFQTSDYTTLYWNWCKWYPDYPDIKFIEDFMETVPHVFHRMGESDDDYECFENCGDEWDMTESVSLLRDLSIDDAGTRIKAEGNNEWEWWEEREQREEREGDAANGHRQQAV